MKKIFSVAIVAATALFSACDNGHVKGNFKTDIDTLSYAMGVAMSAGEDDFKNMLAQQGSDSAYVDEFLKGFVDGMQAADDKKKMAYNAGIQAGMQLKSQMGMVEQQVFQGDSTKKVSIKNFIAGFTAQAKGKVALTDGDSVMTREGANKLVMDYMFSKQKKESVAFMEKKAKEAGVKPLSEGILYKEIAKGTGEKCGTKDSVIVKYEGKLANGTVFDSSNDKNQTLSLRNVIKGWQLAIPEMPVGATWEIYLPFEVAYGERGSGPIPPYSALVFRITLVGTK